MRFEGSPFLKSLLQKKNLEILLETLLFENNKLQNIVENGAQMSNQLIYDKRGMYAELDASLHYFYSLSGIHYLKKPKIVVKKVDIAENCSQYARILTNQDWPLGACMAAWSGLATFALSLSPLPALFASFAAYMSFYIASYSAFNTSLLNEKNPPKAYSVGNKIVIPPLFKDDIIFTIMHEYTHYARRKTKTDSFDFYVEEGLASVIGIKTLEKRAEDDKTLIVYPMINKMIALFSGAEIISHSLGVKLPLNEIQQTLKKVNAYPLEYSLGIAMLIVAEKKYGDALYKELFSNNNEILLA